MDVSAGVYIMRECSELTHFWATLAKFWPSIGHKMSENSGFRPLSEQVPLCGITISRSMSNMVFTQVIRVFANDAISCRGGLI